MNSLELPTRPYAVATNIDKARSDPDLSMFMWIDMKTKNNFVNMKQVHFADKQKAVEFYNLIKQKDLIVFKNWT